MDAAKIKALTARFPMSTLANGNIRTSPARLSFPHLFKPQAPMQGDGKPKYSATLLFPLGADLAIIKAAVQKLGTEKFASTPGPKLFNPLQDQGKDEKAGLDGYVPGAFFVTASSVQRPGIVGHDVTISLTEDQVYPGMWVRATLRPYTFTTVNKEGKIIKRGVSMGLQNVQKLADDDRFGGGGSKANDDFDSFDAAEAEAADMFA